MNHLATIFLVAGLAVCWSELATSAAVDAPLPYMYLLQPVYIRAADESYGAEEGSQPLVEEQQQVSRRVRRSFAPGAPQLPTSGSGNGNGVDVSVTRERGVGTVVSGQAQGNVYRSPDGNTRVDAHGQWQRVYGGPQRGQRTHGAGVTFSHRW
uniref:Attacin C-terminal domain-containing protein n=1 Tax=Timema monikensis TaxID=170555 RepID=A0A7R9EKH7_9NEOP|nr:unnamed protein product [Timema monikensis]